MEKRQEMVIKCLLNDLIDYLSGVTFEVSLAKRYFHAETTADHSTHRYLLRLPRSIWRNIVKLRCSNHKLEIETGLYACIDRHMDINLVKNTRS